MNILTASIFVLVLIFILVVLGLILITGKLAETERLSVSNLIGPLDGTTCREQCFEIFNRVLENEELFYLVAEDGMTFSGTDLVLADKINTSKFCELVIDNATVPMQATSAERYLRYFKNDTYKNNVV